MLRWFLKSTKHNDYYAKWLQTIHCMKDKLVKGKKRKINWREVIFHLHNFDVSRDFDLFCAKHPKMSFNRCAYNVLKIYCSTASMRFMRNYFKKSTLSEKEVVEWFLFYLKCDDELDFGVNHL